MKTLTALMTAFIIAFMPMHKSDAVTPGIPVFDAAIFGRELLEWVEWTFQHSQMLIDTDLLIEQAMTMSTDLELTLDRVRGIFSRMDPTIVEDIIREHEINWGSTAMVLVLQEVDPGSPQFAEIMREAFIPFLGGEVLQEDEIEERLETWAIGSEAGKTNIRDMLLTRSKRHDDLQSGMLVSAQAIQRIQDITASDAEIVAALESLGDNSDTASIQLNALATTNGNRMNKEIVMLLASLLENQQREAIYGNFDQMQDRATMEENALWILSDPVE